MEQVPPRVGIVLRTRDRPFFLERALRDIAAQDLQDWRAVVMNDGGDPAAVRAIVDRLEPELRGRATVLDVELPGGRCAAANQGWQALATPYVVLHDDDDWWEGSFLSTTAEWLDAHPGDGGVMTATEIVFERAEGEGYVETGRESFWAGMSRITFFDLLTVNRAVPISFLYRRELHDEVGGYDETLETVEDWEFYLRVTAAHPIAFLAGRPLAFWSQRPAASDAAANSMFSLADEHRRDDALVRDRALRAWVRENGPGLPLFVAGVVNDALARQEESLRRLLDENEIKRRRWTPRGIAARVRDRVRGR